MDRNDSDIYTSSNLKTWLNDMCHVLILTGVRYSVGKEMAGSSHTLICYLSKPAYWQYAWSI